MINEIYKHREFGVKNMWAVACWLVIYFVDNFIHLIKEISLYIHQFEINHSAISFSDWDKVRDGFQCEKTRTIWWLELSGKVLHYWQFPMDDTVLLISFLDCCEGYRHNWNQNLQFDQGLAMVFHTICDIWTCFGIHWHWFWYLARNKIKLVSP